MSKQKFSLGDLGAVPTSSFPTTLADVEGGSDKPERGMRMMMSDRDDNRGDGEERERRYSDADLTFTRGTKSANTGRGGSRGGGYDRGFERSDRPPRREGNFERSGDVGSGRQPRRQMMSEPQESDYGRRPGPATEERSPTGGFQRRSSFSNEEANLPMRGSKVTRDAEPSQGGGGGLGFSRGAKVTAEEQGGMMMRRVHKDGPSFAQRRAILKEERAKEEAAAAEKATADLAAAVLIAAERAEMEPETPDLEDTKEPVAVEGTLPIEEPGPEVQLVDQATATPNEERPFEPASLAQDEITKLTQEMGPCFDSRDFKILTVICEHLDCNVYNAIGSFLVPLVLHCFTFAFKQNGELPRDEFQAIVTYAIDSLRQLFDRSQIEKNVISQRIIWEVCAMNTMLFKEAALTQDIYIADAVLCAFYHAGVLDKKTANAWFNMELNNSAHAPKNAMTLWRVNQKCIKGFCKLIEGN